MNRLLSVALLGLTFVLGSCDEASAPEGRDGAVTVRAYVDRDASGTLTEGDSLIQNFQVSLVRDGSAVAIVSTGADGTGVANDLTPGSYRVQIAGGEPTGAALLTNPSPTVVVSFQGDTTAVDFRYAFFPGVVTGRLFIDNGATPGMWDEGDTPGPGIRVFLRANNGGVPGDTIETVTTGADGYYTFPLVAPGSYFVEFEKPGDFDYGEAGEIRAVTVTGQETEVMDAIFTGSLLITIEEARARTSGTVLVRGNVIARPGSFTSGTDGVNSEIWIQDETGGIAVFSVPTADSALYAIGDLLEVRGTRTAFAGQEQIAGGAALSVTDLGSNTIRTATAVTGTELNSLANEGELVVIDSVQVTGVGGGTGASFSVIGTARDGQTIAIRVHGPTTAQTNTGLTREDFVVGNYYQIRGVLTENVFNDVSTPQIKPRSRSDVIDRTAPPPPFTGVRFTEIHYDNYLGDVGESIEVEGPAGMDLTGWTVVLYNGSPTSNAPYGTPAALGPVPASCGTRGVIVIEYPANGIQNGSPDGFALVNAAGEVVEFLSYEGVFTAVGGPADGMTSTDIGVSQDGSETGSPVGHSLQRKADGTWMENAPNTFGACNEPPVTPPPSAPTRFSEIHYDNAGADEGEAIEIAGPAGTDLTGWSIALYNLTGGALYNTVNLTETLPATCGGRGVIVVPIAGIQNGPQDGFALVNAAGEVVEFLSYEGTLTATDGPAAGLTSTDIGVFENFDAPIGVSLQRVADGSWVGPIENTFGACNDN